MSHCGKTSLFTKFYIIIMKLGVFYMTFMHFKISNFRYACFFINVGLCKTSDIDADKA